MVELTEGAFDALPYKARLFLRMLEKEGLCSTKV